MELAKSKLSKCSLIFNHFTFVNFISIAAVSPADNSALNYALYDCNLRVGKLCHPFSRCFPYDETNSECMNRERRYMSILLGMRSPFAKCTFSAAVFFCSALQIYSLFSALFSSPDAHFSLTLKMRQRCSHEIGKITTESKTMPIPEY